MRWYGVLFAITTLISMSFLLPGVQSNSIASGMQNAFSIPPLYTGIGVAIFLGFIIFGGIKRIGKTAEIIVPIMAVGYILVAVFILIINIQEIPAMIM